MKHSSISILLLFSLLYLQICHCTQNTTELTQEQRDAREIQLITTKLRTFYTWLKEQAKSEDTFVGRCAGAFKKMRMAFSFIIFMLGVIVTSLAFLSALTFKGLGIGVAILIMSAVGFFSKLTALKHSSENHGHLGAVHLHVHNKGGSGGYYHEHGHDHGWYDRAGHIAPKNDLERDAVADLYRRLGISDSYDGSTIGSNGISIS